MIAAANPDISVAVVNWNRRDHLRACLTSLAGQRGVNSEVIVVDNGSAETGGGGSRSHRADRAGSASRLELAASVPKKTKS